MPIAFGDMIAEIVAAPGTAAFNLGTAATGCRLFSAATEADGTAIGNADTGEYAATAIDANGNPAGGWELGTFTFNTGAPNTLTRTVRLSSNANAAVNFTGNVRVELVGTAQQAFAPLLPEFGGTTQPATPSEGQALFTRARAGRRNLAKVTPAGLVREMQSQIGLWQQRLAVAASNVSTLNAWGWTVAAIGTATARAPVFGGSFFSETIRAGNVSSATAGSSGGVRMASAPCTRGNVAGRGGFYFICRFGINSIPSDGRWFVGLMAAGTIANVDPSTLTQIAGIGCDSGDTTIQLLVNDSSGLATKTDLGANFPAKTNAADLYELRLFAEPNGTVIGWSVERLEPANAQFASGTFASNLPGNTVGLSPQNWINNGATAVACGIDTNSIFLETRF